MISIANLYEGPIQTVGEHLKKHRGKYLAAAAGVVGHSMGKAAGLNLGKAAGRAEGIEKGVKLAANYGKGLVSKIVDTG